MQQLAGILKVHADGASKRPVKLGGRGKTKHISQSSELTKVGAAGSTLRGAAKLWHSMVLASLVFKSELWGIESKQILADGPPDIPDPTRAGRYRVGSHVPIS